MYLLRIEAGKSSAWRGVLGCVALAAHGFAASAAELYAGDAYWSGGLVAVPIFLDAPAGEEISGLQFDLGFEPTAYSVRQATLGEGPAAAGKQPVLTDIVPGNARLLVTGLNQEPIPDGLVATLYLTPRENVPQLPDFPLGQALATDPFGFPVVLTPLALGGTGLRDALQDRRISGTSEDLESAFAPSTGAAPLLDAVLEALGATPLGGLAGRATAPFADEAGSEEAVLASGSGALRGSAGLVFPQGALGTWRGPHPQGTAIPMPGGTASTASPTPSSAGREHAVAGLSQDSGTHAPVARGAGDAAVAWTFGESQASTPRNAEHAATLPQPARSAGGFVVVTAAFVMALTVLSRHRLLRRLARIRQRNAPHD